MSLSCSCNYDYDYDPHPGDWVYDSEEEDFEPFEASRRKRCQSCNKFIEIGTPCLKFTRSRYPYDEIESRKKGYGDLESALSHHPSITISPHYHCERCGEIYLNLVAIGYKYIWPMANMEDLLKEYHEISGFKNG